jgi:uncharacterized protein (TIGR03086 family)
MTSVDARDALLTTLGSFRERVAGVGDDQWHDPTPCSDWDVRALVNHLVGENRWAAELFRGRTIEEVGEAFEGDLVGDDPLAAYEHSADLVRDAVNEPGVMDEIVHLSFGDVPGRVYAEQLFVDRLVHGWDLAVATGQEAHMPESLAELAYEQSYLARDGIRASGSFADEVDIPPDADDQTKLLALLGRDPSAW